MEIRRVRVSARRLLTLSEEHPAWANPDAVDPSGILWTPPDGFTLDGALVRLHPPADANEERVAALVARLERAGAERVRVGPRVTQAPVVVRIDVDPHSPKLSHREAVLAAVGAARSSDPAALRALLEGILDEEGL